MNDHPRCETCFHFVDHGEGGADHRYECYHDELMQEAANTAGTLYPLQVRPDFGCIHHSDLQEDE